MFLINHRWAGQLHVPDGGPPGYWAVCRGHGLAAVSTHNSGLKSGHQQKLQWDGGRRGGRPVPAAASC